MKNISILGATGSVGINTLKVIEQHLNKYNVKALSTNQNIELLYTQCKKFSPDAVVITDSKYVEKFSKKFTTKDNKPEILQGQEGLKQAASSDDTDYIMAAIVGAAGLPSTLAAAESGKRILLANKEALVMSGNLLVGMAKKNNSLILPIDSEHNAVFQCLPHNQDISQVSKIVLTASGGPFLNKPINEFNSITPDQACAHPNWDMGRKISVDSATMMNKGLEVIEACKLFGVDDSLIEVVIHPQSIIHSMVAYNDGSMLAHLAHPDMRVPIAHCLSWPDRIASGVNLLDLSEISPLEFLEPDAQRFPCLQLAFDALNNGGSAPTVLNAANEIAVESFLNNQIEFTKISDVINEVLQKLENKELNELEEILEIDMQARNFSKQIISNSSVVH